MAYRSDVLDEDFVLDGEKEEVFRKVKRYYAEQDVERWLAENGEEVDDEVFNLIAERYDKWQGENPFWWDAVSDIHANVMREKDMAAGLGGISLRGELQLFDLSDVRCGIWKADYTVPDLVASKLTVEQLESLWENPVFYGNGENPNGSVVGRLVAIAVGAGRLGGEYWTIEDPCEIHADEKDVRKYIEWRESRGLG